MSQIKSTYYIEIIIEKDRWNNWQIFINEKISTATYNSFQTQHVEEFPGLNYSFVSLDDYFETKKSTKLGTFCETS